MEILKNWQMLSILSVNAEILSSESGKKPWHDERGWLPALSSSSSYFKLLPNISSSRSFSQVALLSVTECENPQK